MIISVLVKPGGRKPSCVITPESADEPWVVCTNAKPVEGQANDAVLKLLAAHFGVRPRDVAIKSGHTSRRKIIEINLP